MSQKHPSRRYAAQRAGRILSILAAALGLAVPATAANEVFDARGFAPNRDYFSQLPYEHIDPLTGNLLLTFTDLVLPGNAGFDLKIQRTYNSKIFQDYQNSGDTLDEDSWAGVGWTLHLGRVLHTASGIPASVEMPDGSRQKLYQHIDSSGRFITRNFWVYNGNVNPPVLLSPDGTKYTLERSTSLLIGGVSTPVRYPTRIEDPFGNFFTVAYMSTPADGIQSITQDLGGARCGQSLSQWPEPGTPSTP